MKEMKNKKQSFKQTLSICKNHIYESQNAEIG